MFESEFALTMHIAKENHNLNYIDILHIILISKKIKGILFNTKCPMLIEYKKMIQTHIPIIIQLLQGIAKVRND